MAGEEVDYSLRETRPSIGGDRVSGNENLASSFDLVEQMKFLFVRIVRARDLPLETPTGIMNPYVEIKIGNYRATTKYFEKKPDSEWKQVFAFTVDRLQGTTMEINVINEDMIGKCVIHLLDVDQRLLPLPAKSKWCNLEDVVFEDCVRKEEKFFSKLNMRVSLDGGYHVFDESIHFGSDYRPTVKVLWTTMIGVLELGIINATGLQPMKVRDGRETTDAYCVAKYGPKWEFLMSVTCMMAMWPEMEKIRPNGVKRTGEIQLAIRFTCTSYFNLFLVYTMNPMLPPMHHIYPLSIYQLDSLREQATRILCLSLSRTEPPLRSEVVEYMLDGDARKWFDEIRKWKNPTATVAVIAIYCIIALKPDLILPAVILCGIQAMILQWWKRLMHPTHIDAKQFVPATADEPDEEFDTFPSSRRPDVLWMRYDRLRSIAGRFVTVIGDIATLLERLPTKADFML
ncbi:hypothetical protein F3Y22_tig00005406pilonHSYRG00443 [Hibiscus syriacus]|uniref:C2 domain-containing protein n=1 Tax=Hibiscus syriacus TaxID=106335 RepID=A0A6A3CEQ5_HIBSY|nr:hypothetical protein F3Y22_tig00005406pilonHSYRG00443 [Hibiscus syriacus]